MTKSDTFILELIDKTNPCWPSMSEIRLEARKKGIWKEVRRELKKRYRDMECSHSAGHQEVSLNDTGKKAQELVQIYLSHHCASWSISDLRNEAINMGLKWSDIQREFRRIKYERDAKIGKALSQKEGIIDVKYPHWEIGYERGLSDAWFERYLRLKDAVGDMMSCGVTMDKIADYTDLSEEELQRIIESHNNDGKSWK